MLKRRMYGPAGFVLLRACVLPTFHLRTLHYAAVAGCCERSERNSAEGRIQESNQSVSRQKRIALDTQIHDANAGFQFVTHQTKKSQFPIYNKYVVRRNRASAYEPLFFLGLVRFLSFGTSFPWFNKLSFRAHPQ
jgi:hypothetical protein